MPELPEVETVRRGLERTVVGKTIASVEIRVPKIFPVEPSAIDSHLVGATIESVERRAKVVLVHLSNDRTLAIHLKMTGQIIVVGSKVASSKEFTAGHPEKAYEQPLPHKHTHVIIRFTGGVVLYFNDLRKFGWMRLLPRSRKYEVGSMGTTIDEFLAEMKHGPEPLGNEFTADYLYQQAKKRAIPIKSFLLDQSVVAGIGNIYADEALFESRIKPTRKSKSLTRTEAERLHAAIKHVLALGIEHGGTTLNTYRNVEGTAGTMSEHLKVYGRGGQPCLRASFTPGVSVPKLTPGVVPERCPGVIKRIKIGQRSAHFCATCQS